MNETDTRDKLAEGVREFAQSLPVGNASYRRNAHDTFMGWLDRQAAITEREWKAEWGDYQQQRIADLLDTISHLESERDELADELNTLNLAYETLRAETKRTDDGWMRLPVDMNGETIHVGDVLESDAFGRIEVEGFVHGAVAFWSYDPQPARLATCPCNLTRHVRQRTVEDVLCEYYDERGWDEADNCALEADTLTSKYADELRELMGGDA